MKALLPLSWLYRAVVGVRNRYYDLVGGKKLPVPVVSVGNVTVGGSGKTPFVAVVARELRARNLPVAVVSRGYGRESKDSFVLVSDGDRVLVSAREGGDEPVELAQKLPGVAVAVGADRFRTGQKLLDELGPRVIVLDDGFQHRRLARDVDLVCFDCREPASSLHLLPAGRLREPLESLNRADAVVLTRWSETCEPPELGAIPAIRAASRSMGFTRLDGGDERLEPGAFRGSPVGVALGVARPERVLETLEADVVELTTRRDHHGWRESELREIAEGSKAKGARALLTTGKDAVKMAFSAPMPLPVYRIDFETEVLDPEILRDLLAFPPP